MAELEEAVYSRLNGNAGVSAIVGTRIYPEKIPQEATLPAVAYARISARRARSHSGPGGLARPRIQVTCVAASYSEAKALAAATRKALDGIGVGGPVTVGGVEVHGSWLDTDADEYGDAEGLHSVRQDFVFWCRETV